MTRTYLDYNATTPILPDALKAITETLQCPGIPSSTHKFGKEMRQRIDAAREKVAGLVNAPVDGVIFTSGATEANNLFLKGVATKRWIVSSIEHSSVLKPIAEVEKIAATKDGLIDLDSLEALLKKSSEPALVSVMLVNNETGVIQPVQEAAALAHKYGAIVHTDAVQATGRISIDMKALGVDFLTLSAHKMGGPAGIGALVMTGCTELTPLIGGSSQEKRRRAGTENSSGIVGLGVVAEHAAKTVGDYSKRLVPLRNRLEQAIAAAAPEAVIFGHKAPRVANTSFIGLPGITSDVQQMALDLAGFAVSGGAACNSGTVAASHVLKAMGVADNLSNAAIRISLGWKTTDADIDAFIAAWVDMYKSMRARLTSAA